VHCHCILSTRCRQAAIGCKRVNAVRLGSIDNANVTSASGLDFLIASCLLAVTLCYLGYQRVSFENSSSKQAKAMNGLSTSQTLLAPATLFSKQEQWESLRLVQGIDMVVGEDGFMYRVEIRKDDKMDLVLIGKGRV
jgi:hypothetical protein